MGQGAQSIVQSFYGDFQKLTGHSPEQPACAGGLA